jgi:hypothetical protein
MLFQKLLLAFSAVLIVKSTPVSLPTPDTVISNGIDVDWVRVASITVEQETNFEVLYSNLFAEMTTSQLDETRTRLVKQLRGLNDVALVNRFIDQMSGSSEGEDDDDMPDGLHLDMQNYYGTTDQETINRIRYVEKAQLLLKEEVEGRGATGG